MRFLALLLVLLTAYQPAFAGVIGGSISGGVKAGPTGVADTVFTNTAGLQTSPEELDTFLSLEGSEGGQYTTDLTALGVTALDSKDDWDWPLTAGAWESDSGRCEPAGETTAGQYLGEAAADIYAMALYGYLTNDTDYYAAAKTRLLQLAATTDFGDDGVFSGADQCALDLGTAVPVAIEAALLLEQEYVNWSAADRLAVATWAAEETVPLTSWAAISRKNNWGFLGLSAMIATSYYAQGGIALLDVHDGLVAPADYLANADELLAAQLSTSDPLIAASPDCSTAGQPYGLQTHGGFPDELRRTGGTTNCGDDTITEVMGACVAAGDCATGTAHFYQQKATNAFSRIAESLRRIDGNGARGFDLATHGGSNEALYDAASFSTSGFTTFVQDTTMGFVHVACSYYNLPELCALSDSENVPLRGGLDQPYTRITHAPGVSYAWTLGDLSDQSSRFDVLWDTGEWADPYDTEAELLAAGWTSHAVNATSCTDQTGTTDSGDEAAFIADIDEICDPGGANDNDCSTPDGNNKIIRLEANCHYDLTAGSGGGSDSAPAFLADYSNVAYVGSGMDSTYIDCNDGGNESIGAGPCVANTSGGSYGIGTTGTNYTWASGNTVGTTSITLSGASCDPLDPGDPILLRGSTADGENHWIQNEVASQSGCDIGLVDPIRMTVNTISTAQEMTAYANRNVHFIGLSIGFPQYPDGVARDLGTLPGATLRWIRGSGLNLASVRLGPSGPVTWDNNLNFHSSLRHSEIGPCQFCKRRGTNGRVFNWNRSSGIGGSFSVFNNNLTGAAKRFIHINNGATVGSWFGFNYMDDFLATAPGEGGNHCTGVTTPQGIAMHGIGPGDESSIFLGHEALTSGKHGGTLVEANDLNCTVDIHGDSGNTVRWTTFYRNRQNRTQGNWGFSGSFNVYRANIIATRLNDLPANGSIFNNVLGRWNVGENTMGAQTATGASWPTTGTYKNYVDTGPHDDYGTVNIPPSLALRQDQPPDWWCQESGPWDGTWSFAYGDGGDNGGVPRKLPAQIRYEGGTCTAP